MKLRKMLAILSAVLLLAACVPVGVLPAALATADGIVLDLTDKANRTEYSSTKQVWEQNGITVTNEKGASTTNVADKANPGRFYKSSTVTIEYPGMTSIVIDSVTYDDMDYAGPWAAIEYSNVTATVEDGNVTIVFANAVDSFTWETMSAQARAYTITVYTDGATPEAPEKPEEPETPAINKLTIAEAIALGAAQADSSYTEEKYYVTGVISQVYSPVFGNMYIQDKDGNKILVYGTWSADGSIRYDALEVKPVAGDTITIYGAVGNYKGAPQIKNGWIVECVPHDHIYDNMCDTTCSMCSEIREVPGHIYDNLCDVDCDMCGELREVLDHMYANACDIDCDRCGAVRQVAGHSYDNDCDIGCNICDEMREAPHLFEDVCDRDCNVCGVIRIAPHVYDSICDGDCNNCGYKRKPMDHIYSDSCDTDCNVCGVKREPHHDYEDDYDDTCDTCGWWREVPERPTAIPGDANGDGAINNRDVALLQQYINKWSVEIDLAAADVNADGAINNRDLALLQQYINKWDVTLGK